MVSFDAHVAVTSPDAWGGLAQWAGVPALDTAELRQVDELVIFSAHADDETLGAGGLLARLARTTITIRIVVATGDTDRASELRGALLALGVHAEVEFLGLADGGLKHESEQLRREIDRVLEQSGARSLTLGPWPGDRHGDHRTLGREVSDAARTTGTRLLFYPVWLWQWGTPDDVPWKRLVDVELTESERDAKAAAIRCFTSQLAAPSNPAGVLSPEFIRHISTNAEVLIRPEWAELDAHFEQLRSGRSDSAETSALHLDALRDLKSVNTHLVAAAAYPVLANTGELLSTRLRTDL